MIEYARIKLINNDLEVAHPQCFFVYLIPCRIGIEARWFVRREENRNTRRKTSWSKGENQQQTQPTYGIDAGI